MVIHWYHTKKDVEKLINKVAFNVNEDYDTPKFNCIYTFPSVSECVKAINLLYPLATFSINIDLKYNHGYVSNFKNNEIKIDLRRITYGFNIQTRDGVETCGEQI